MKQSTAYNGLLHKGVWQYPSRAEIIDFEGEHGRVPLRRGLSIHYCDGFDRHNLTGETELLPGLALYVFLSEPPGARIGGRPLLPDRPEGGGGPQAVLVSRTRPEQLIRYCKAGHRTRKVAITASPEWLADCGLDIKGDGTDIASFADRHLAQLSWLPDRRLIAAAETILQASPYTESLRRLHLESRVIDLLADTYAMVANGVSGSPTARLKAQDRQRVRRVEDYLASADPASLSLADLAAHAGISVSTLQRLFQAVHGMSPVEFIRRDNLERARQALRHEGISVKEAAYRAGYTHTANFSTAFRRQFGYSPGTIVGG